MNGSHRRLERSRTDRWVAGVCSGVARYFGTSALLVRLLFLITVLATSGVTVLIYLTLWAMLPQEGTQSPDPIRENLDEIRSETERWMERIKGWLQSLGLLRGR